MCRRTYSVHSTCFFLYQGYDIPVSGKAHCMFFDDDSDNSYGEDHDDEYDVMRMIERNDPTLTELHGYLPPADSLEEFGRAIGKNTHLKEIAFLGFDNDEVDRDVIPSKDFLNFLLGFALNRSIQKLIFACWDLPDADWRILIRFFNDNQASECLEVEDYGDGRSLSALASALQRFDSLKEFRYCCGDSYVECDSVIEALIGHNGRGSGGKNVIFSNCPYDQSKYSDPLIYISI